MLSNKKGQIWIETVLYTIIGLVAIALVLSFITPKINQSKEQSLIEQSIESIRSMESKINEVYESGSGNIRQVDLSIKKGVLNIYPEEDKLELRLEEITKPFSEPGEIIPYGGNVYLITEKIQKDYAVKIVLNYTKINLTYNKDEKPSEDFYPTSIPYKIKISNLNNELIDLEVV